MKKGISLIAVLMFMLAATTAGVVLYKWIGSENFASGSRLKQSEAYQASEAGLDAVYAWLSYKAPDVGAVVKEFDPKKPYELTGKNNVLGQLNNNPNIYFRVYLTSVDATNIRKIKLKFQSIGVGRDGSKVQQTAIYSVNGLYKLNFQGTQTKTSKCTDYDEDFWGNMGTVNEIESARAVVTQDVSIKNAGGQALNKVTIGTAAKPGYLVLDGNYYANAGIDVYGDVYSTGDFDFCSTGSLNNDNIRGNLYVEKEFHPKGAINITGHAYLKGGVNPNRSINNGVTGGTGGCVGQASGGVVYIGENSTIQGNFTYWSNTGGGGLGFHVAKNLVMDAGTITLTRQGSNSSDSLAAYGNVYIKNALTGTVPNTDTKPIPFFGNKTTDTVCVSGMTAVSGKASYWKNSAGIEMRSKATNVQASCTPKSHWYADKLDYLKSKLSDDPNKRSCENPPIQFDASIYDEVKKTNPVDWVHRKDKPGSCEKTARCGWESSTFCGGNNNLMELAFPSYPPRDIGADLQNCYTDTKNKSNERKGGEWLVVYVKDDPTNSNQDIKTNASKWGGSPTPTTITSGKYIIIYELSACNNNGQQCFLYLPPTAKGVEIMLYLPKGFPGRIELAGTPKGKSCSKTNRCDDYNYFIFSDGDINQFDATDSRKLHGNIFMNKCSVMNLKGVEGNGFLTTESNSEFVKELMDQGVLCMFEERGENCAVPNLQGCKPPEDELPPVPDDFFVPISPRLRVDLESKYISKESVSGDTIVHSVLVMPRIIRFNKTDAPSITNLKNYYNFLYLNGAKDPALREPANCGDYSPTAPVDGIYKCVFNDSKISPFFLQIHSGSISDAGGSGGGGGGGGSGTSSPSGLSSSSKASSSSTGSGGGVSSSSDSGYSLSSASYTPWCSVPSGCYDYPVPVPQYGCGGGLNSEATAAKFKYTSWSASSKTVSKNDVKWNRSPPQAQAFGSTGKNRDIYMYQVRCDGDRIDLGTDDGLGADAGILCGTIDATSAGGCDYDPWCRVGGCYTGASNASVPPPEYGCGLGGTVTSTDNLSFRYTASNHGNLESTSPSTAWKAGNTFSISTRSNADVYMYAITCDGNEIGYGSPGNKGGILCEGSFTVAATCPSSNSVSSSSRASSSSTVPLSSAAACAYQDSWCNGDYHKAQNVPTTPSTTYGSCFFVSDISKMQGASFTINGVAPANNNNSEFACGQSWAAGSPGNASCSSLLTAKKDGGYYVYVGSWISNFNYTTGSINCGGSTPSVSSSSSTPSSSSGASVGCSISGVYTVASGSACVNISTPTVSNCSSPAANGFTFKVGSSKTAVTAWTDVSTGANAQFCSGRYGTDGEIWMTRATCNNTAYTNEVKCGDIVVNRPTCNNMPTSIASGSGGTITPTVICGGSVTPTNINQNSFATTSTGCTWTGSGTGGYFTRTSTGDCKLTLNNVTCGAGGNLSSLGIDCYTGSGTHPSSTSTNVSVTVSGGGSSTNVCNSFVSFPAGTYTVNVASSCCSGGSCSFQCYGNDNVTKTVTFDGTGKTGNSTGSALYSGNTGWQEKWSKTVPFTNVSLVVSAGTVQCRYDN